MEKFYDSELKVMQVLWEYGQQTAGEIANRLEERWGWHRNTSYTVLKKLVAKGAVRREEPGFVCTALVSREQAQRQETQSLIARLFSGSRMQLLASMFTDESLSPQEVEQLQELVERLK